MAAVRIFILDDEEAVCEMYKLKLESEGFAVSFATDPQEGFERIKRERPDLALLDIIMPQLNGIDILRMLKEDKETAGIPVFLLTNLPQEAGLERGKELGAAGYFVKAHFEPAVLAERLKEELRKLPLQAAKERGAKAPAK